MTPAQLKAIRTDLGLTQEELAEVLRLTRATIGHYETGKRVPTATIAMLYQELESGWRPRTLRELPRRMKSKKQHAPPPR